MEDAFTAPYLNDAVQQFRQLKSLAEKALAQISDEKFFLVLDEEANSIAALMKHMAGSMRARWRGFPSVADDETGRNRDSEFVTGEGETTGVLFDRWEDGWRCLFDAVESLTADDMAKTVVIRGNTLSVIEAINRQLTHYAYHVGQIVLLAKHFRSGAWQSLSIPRGKSEEFSSAARRGRQV
jgi:Protein of unknown function (DUF1572)